MKYFRLTYDYIMHEITFVNLTMLAASIPKYEGEKKEDTPKPPPTKDPTLNDFLSFVD